MAQSKQIIGEPLIVGGRQLSLSRAVRAGDFVFLTGQLPLDANGAPMSDAGMAEQTHAVLKAIAETLAQADCGLEDVVKTMVWLTDRADFPTFNEVYAQYFPDSPPARSAVVSDLLLDVRLEVEVTAYRPQSAS